MSVLVLVFWYLTGCSVHGAFMFHWTWKSTFIKIMFYQFQFKPMAFFSNTFLILPFLQLRGFLLSFAPLHWNRLSNHFRHLPQSKVRASHFKIIKNNKENSVSLTFWKDRQQWKDNCDCVLSFCLHITKFKKLTNNNQFWTYVERSASPKCHWECSEKQQSKSHPSS